jgi:hypothetical protein
MFEKSTLIAVTAAVCLFAGPLYGQSSPGSLAELDAESAKLVSGIAERLKTQGAGEDKPRITVENFSLEGYDSPLGTYWRENLKDGLSNIQNRNYDVAANSGGQGANHTITGEIVDIVDTLRIYTRLIRNSAILYSWHTDLVKNEFLAQLTQSNSSSGPYVARDSYETDSMENPVNGAIGETWISRTLHRDDRDFFRLAPDQNGRLVLETASDLDTFMELYDQSGRKVREDDDGGDSGNARISHSVEAGSSYIALVRGYSEDETGPYRFRAYIREEITDTYENDNSSEEAKDIAVGETQNRTFSDGDDVDWARLRITQAGEYEINSQAVGGSLDSYLELYDEEESLLNEDDDGGENYNARLRIRLDPGVYLLKLSCLDNTPPNDGAYTLSVTQVNAR